ncbi:MAG TPA: replicative DNA helicase [Candidatus Limnocylindrales bacterium]|nr:replicative DNA helicase [Candidatus Limnocylindrales bacterium]
MDENKAAYTRVPPHSQEAEESVLGALLTDSDAFDRIADLVVATDFYAERHARIFAAISSLQAQARPADVITVTEALKHSGELQRVGGTAYLVELAEKVVTAANVDHYARLIHDKSILRRLIRTSSEILTGAYESRGATREFLDKAEQAIFELSSDHSGTALRRIDTLIGPTVERIEMLFERKSDVTGVATGYYDLDHKTAGLQPSDLIIVAGRPSMGKTAFCLNIAEYAAGESNVGVAIFSMEMSSDQLVMRMLCSQAEIDNSRVRTGNLHDRDIKNIALTAGKLGGAPIYIDDTAAQTVLEIRAKARRLKHDAQAGLGLIIIDYLQLMRGTGEDSREQEISAISRSLKALAKELSVPIVALSQLNRQVEQRADKRPGMADLRESGALEQDADVIVFLYRDEQYNADTPEPGVAEIIIAKQRNGPTGTVRLMFDKAFARFRNFSTREDASSPAGYGGGRYE